MNVVTSPSPPYLHACTQLGLDPDNPVLSLIPNAMVPGHVDSIGRVSKPWQVQYLLWLDKWRRRVSSHGYWPTRLGLGKTMAAIAHIVVHTGWNLCRAQLTPEGKGSVDWSVQIGQGNNGP